MTIDHSLVLQNNTPNFSPITNKKKIMHKKDANTEKNLNIIYSHYCSYK